MRDLCLYARMQAWLRLTPKEGSGTNADRYGVDYPEIPYEFGHMPDFLDEAGTVGQGFGGYVPLTYLEIEAWARMTNITLTRFEAVALRNMSAVYASMAGDPEADCPIMSDSIRRRRDEIAMASWGAFGK